MIQVEGRWAGYCLLARGVTKQYSPGITYITNFYPKYGEVQFIAVIWGPVPDLIDFFFSFSPLEIDFALINKCITYNYA